MITPLQLTQEDVLRVLESVKDPEIDTVSIIDLGMVEKVTIENKTVLIDILPTFVGCPALEIIRNNIIKAVNIIEGVEETTCELYQFSSLDLRSNHQKRIFRAKRVWDCPSS